MKITQYDEKELKDQLKKRHSYHKKRLKGLPRVGFNPNAGNVELSLNMFNHANSAVGGPSNNPVSGPMGGDVSAPSGGMGEELNVSLKEARNPYFAPYGYRDAAKVLNGKAPQYYYHLKEIEMDCGDGIKLAKYALRKGLPVMIDSNSDPDYPEFAIKGEYHWNDYFYPYPTAHEEDLIPWDGKLFIEQQLTETKLMLSEDVELYYPELTIEVTTRRGRSGGYYDHSFGNWLPDDGDTEEVTIDYTYNVDYSDIVEFLFSDCLTEEDVPGLHTFDDDELNAYVDKHFDSLFSKYEDKILDHWVEAASQHAEETQDW